MGEPSLDRAFDAHPADAYRPRIVRDERPLFERLADVPGAGTITWIGLRPAHEAPMVVTEEAMLLVGRGIEGDRACRSGGTGKRNVTLVQAEHLAVIAALVGREVVSPDLLRRNLVVAGLNLIALKTQRFAIGESVVLEGTGPCEPCSKMDAALGVGGFHAMRGHGGITARILEGGVVRLGDRVRVVRG